MAESRFKLHPSQSLTKHSTTSPTPTPTSTPDNYGPVGTQLPVFPESLAEHISSSRTLMPAGLVPSCVIVGWSLHFSFSSVKWENLQFLLAHGHHMRAYSINCKVPRLFIHSIIQYLLSLSLVLGSVPALCLITALRGVDLGTIPPVHCDKYP